MFSGYHNSVLSFLHICFQPVGQNIPPVLKYCGVNIRKQLINKEDLSNI